MAVADPGADPAPDARQIAEAVGRAMVARDATARALGITLEEIAPGYARVAMAVRDDMTNLLGLGHGGMTFTLADAAFGYACNSRNRSSVAQIAQINYLRPTRLGDRLTAAAREQAAAGRSAVYDVEVSNQDGEVVALFRGQSHAVEGRIVADLPIAP